MRVSLSLVTAALSCLGVLSGAPRVSASDAEDAQALVASGLKRAEAEQKAVFVLFTGERCFACQLLDGLLQSEPVRSVMASSFVTVRLTIGDRKRSTVTPGAFNLLKSWARTACGVPFYVFLSAAGARIAEGCGFPSTAEGIDEFLAAVGRSAPHLTDSQRAALRDATTHAVGDAARRMDGAISWGYLRSQYRARSMAAAVACMLGVALSWVAWRRHARHTHRPTPARPPAV